ncbi:methylenetetrahydrofolate reductase [NAD(P)H] [Alkaliphilus peptidifermentans]|uniref:Methylenetetrahydrofolate reductase n=1 Tax=Alkaliphilus peptidifermentans DSM 18978 TaxID=1120976 RepID=A0A1G5KGN7_9FIRM|nr:methylenetetrahydrofolate reductase [NAD(P)H] [Alkaliphilus peptidifermentans]SCY99208.1 5,10-methylenetetrahydrofolate reductase (NAD(P)) [Alkaliphilus peptidifermentans DSM 18978]
MLIKDIFKEKTVISLEIFPPKPTSPLDTITNMLEEIKDLTPDFISITYGAGGSTKRHTVDIASMVKNKYKIEALAHLTCINSTKDEINRIFQLLKENNIENILALRGDHPDNQPINIEENQDFNYAKDLASYAKSYGGFSLGGACYPEGHLECKNTVENLHHLKEKVDNGLDFLITQLFFDNNLFYNFKEKMELLNIKVPVSAGIMPVINKKQVEKIISLTGASISPKFLKILDKYGDNPSALKEAGIAYATEQIIDLMANEVDGIHLYAMNRPEIAKSIFSSIGSIRKYAANS